MKSNTYVQEVSNLSSKAIVIAAKSMVMTVGRIVLGVEFISMMLALW